MMISIGSDHRGFKLKSEIIKHFTNIEFLDVGTNSEDRTDFPVYAKKVCKKQNFHLQWKPLTMAT